jgi:hypothetical protein
MQSESIRAWSGTPYTTFETPRLGDDEQTKATALVPMLDWPSDLFSKFAFQFEAEAECFRRAGRLPGGWPYAIR